MESLFVRHQPRKGRVCLMLGASLLLHSGVVGIGALWTQPEPELHSLPPVEVDFPAPGPTPLGPVEVASPTPNEAPVPTSTLDLDVKVEPTPPEPTGTPDFAQLPEQTPLPRKQSPSKLVSTVRPLSVQTNSHSSPGQPNSNASGDPNGGSTKMAGAWVTPHPPYPRASLAKPTGATTVRITTDAMGQVSNVVILKSAGSPVLDHQTESYVRLNWHGPANSSRTTEFVYQLR